MKWLFTLLLLGNIAFAAWMLLPRPSQDIESASAHTPYHAEKIRLISEKEAQALKTPRTPEICLEWSGLAAQDIERARSALAPLQLAEKDIILHGAEEKARSHWVYIPPLKSRQDAQKKIDELKALGVDDGYIMQSDNQWRHAVSLGVFSTQEAAAKYLEQLRDKGVKSAKAGPRNPEDKRASLTMRSSHARIEEELVQIKQAFPDTELKAVPCAE